MEEIQGGTSQITEPTEFEDISLIQEEEKEPVSQ
jgi:hypothetical protein